MSMNEDDWVRVGKNEIVRELFVRTADDNYVVARWCFFRNLNVDFFWLAVHTLEKYMKAALLLNGGSAKGFRDSAGKPTNGHDVESIYAQVRSLAPELVPSELRQPAELRLRSWEDEASDAFVARLYRYGNADNRYQLFGYLRRPQDLFKLDQMVFGLRRLCRRLEGDLFPGKPQLGTNRAHLLAKPNHWSLRSDGRLEEIANGRRDESLRDALLAGNPQFAPPDYDDPGWGTHTSWRASVLLRTILDPLRGDRSSYTEACAARLRDWVLEEITLPRDVADQLRESEETADNTPSGGG